MENTNTKNHFLWLGYSCGVYVNSSCSLWCSNERTTPIHQTL